MRIALTGGIACGKSLVAKFLNELGVATIDADDIVHELLPDPAERKRIAAEVFADPEKRRALEARLHPLVRERINSFIGEGQGERSRSTAEFANSFIGEGQGERSTRPRIAIIPLLFETRWDAEYDIICCVASDRETQVARMMGTRGYTREEAEARLAAQMPVGEKTAKSHYVIENNGSEEELREKTRAFVAWLKKRVPTQIEEKDDRPR